MDGLCPPLPASDLPAYLSKDVALGHLVMTFRHYCHMAASRPNLGRSSFLGIFLIPDIEAHHSKRLKGWTVRNVFFQEPT